MGASSPLSDRWRLNRRQLLGLGVSGGSSLLLGGCALNGFSEQVGKATQPLNESIEALLQGKGQVPEFRRDQVDPAALLVNSFNGVPQLDPERYRLRVGGLVHRPLSLDLAALAALPQQEITIRHVCVEGWAAIVSWSGVRLADVLALAGVSPLGGYLAIESADQYFSTWDIASALHPQTLLATGMNGAPLPAANGAPLRIATPIKLGYKLSKWVTGLELIATLEDRRGTWEDQGYEWFAGL
ncbi:molybdopterin-dependent oxidoreductase [Synechococcus sp. CS-1325]|uniref:molybdopterin-dependent oxidoreductase n=1 Tax=Synechococcus sp. CS-1325 TaxID=2847979 RepID=UPI000DB4F89B|nr:molybdopterin-dependent oxidoreductase [Synechococcus sp. CS-1325]MCT0199408.1 molybdopterin-dependent oxidoreductase [Synechococcus sp. CS-1325]PZV03091.1 MAG: oxidoreductase [Cyanobium sp.]